MGRWSRIWQKPVSLDPPSRVKLHFPHVPPVGLDPPSRVKFLTAPFLMCFYSIMMRKDLTALEQIPALVIVIVEVTCFMNTGTNDQCTVILHMSA